MTPSKNLKNLQNVDKYGKAVSVCQVLKLSMDDVLHTLPYLTVSMEPQYTAGKGTHTLMAGTVYRGRCKYGYNPITGYRLHALGLALTVNYSGSPLHRENKENGNNKISFIQGDREFGNFALYRVPTAQGKQGKWQKEQGKR